MIRIRKVAAVIGTAAAMTLPAAPALAQDPCVDDAEGSAVGAPADCEGEVDDESEEKPGNEVLDDSLDKPQQAAPDVAGETLAQTGVGSAAMLLAAGGALAIGGGAVTVTRRRRDDA